MHEDIPIATHRNDAAERPLVLTMRLACNTDAESIAENIRANSAREDIPWLYRREAHDGIAVIVGGGPSAADHLREIADWHHRATIFALNGASSWLRANGVRPDYQCIIDAKPETLALLDERATTHLLASQVDPELVEASLNPTLMHLASPGLEEHLPPKRRARGNYVLLGGGHGVGNTALCAAYALGFRELHCYGFDSSHRHGASHAYPQAMNDDIPCVETQWAGRTYLSSLPMRAHAERFQIIAGDLKASGCRVHVHGDGLLPAMFNSPADTLSERDLYRHLWELGSYRDFAPGEHAVETFLAVAKPDGLILDLGCGTGRASVALAERGHAVHMVDFADNCRDPAAWTLPFLEWDLTEPLPISAPYGFCTDVMEHIPPGNVERVVRNIMGAAGTVYFQISTVDDAFGALVGRRLHLTVRPHEWWLSLFGSLGFHVAWQRDDGSASSFLVRHPEGTPR